MNKDIKKENKIKEPSMVQKKPRELVGEALKDSHQNTVAILVNLVKIHPIYKKRYYESRKFLADTHEEIKQGQKVKIIASRPISRRKSWKVSKVYDSII